MAAEVDRVSPSIPPRPREPAERRPASVNEAARPRPVEPADGDRWEGEARLPEAERQPQGERAPARRRHRRGKSARTRPEARSGEAARFDRRA